MSKLHIVVVITTPVKIFEKKLKVGSMKWYLFTPEMLYQARCQNILISDTYSKRLKVFVFDEAHTVKTW